MNPSILAPSLSLITTLNWFPKHRIPRWPSLRVLPSLTHKSTLPPSTQVCNCKDKLCFVLAPFISTEAELQATLFLLEKERSLRYKFGSYQQRDDIGNQVNRCICPNAEAGMGKPWGDNLENRSKTGTMQRRPGISSREGRNDIHL